MLISKKHIATISAYALILSLLVTGLGANTSAVWYAHELGIREAGVIAAAIPGELIFSQSTEAVFMIETFDRDGNSIRTGSGFFITAEGLAITNLHVIDNAASATVTLYNGDELRLRGVCAESEEFNLAMLSVDIVGNDYLTLADSDLIQTGNTVYAIGSPLGYINTMTAGIISRAKRIVDEAVLIQFTAPISFGSGGSPLLNTQGHVIGVASSSFSYGQNLNLAVPINYVKEMQPGEPASLVEMLNR